MDFSDRLLEVASRVPRQLEHTATEEATKNALVLPFINALGYNVFDPTEVVPEFTADVGTKRGEKVDYAVLQDGKPAILFECKSSSTNLDKVHASQLYRYFSVTEARLAVLTNGVIYRFFSDLEAANKMDSRPFLEIDMADLDSSLIPELKKLTKSSFSIDGILASASDLKYSREIKKILAQELASPSDEFVRFFGSQVYSGRLTQAVREQFATIVRRAFQHFINERVNDRLKSALADEDEQPQGKEEAAQEIEEGADDGIETTEEEIEGFHIVRAIVADTVDPSRVTMRDVKSYCGVLLDDNNRQPICRLWFNTSQKYVGLLGEKKNEEREPVEGPADIYRFADRLRETVARYLEE